MNLDEILTSAIGNLAWTKSTRMLERWSGTNAELHEIPATPPEPLAYCFIKAMYGNPPSIEIKCNTISGLARSEYGEEFNLEEYVPIVEFFIGETLSAPIPRFVPKRIVKDFGYRLLPKPDEYGIYHASIDGGQVKSAR